MSISTGTLLGDRYRLHDLLGRGGVADVYRATDQVLDREVAVKVLRASHPEPASENASCGRRGSSATHHPGITPSSTPASGSTSPSW